MTHDIKYFLTVFALLMGLMTVVWRGSTAFSQNSSEHGAITTVQRNHSETISEMDGKLDELNEGQIRIQEAIKAR